MVPPGDLAGLLAQLPVSAGVAVTRAGRATVVAIAPDEVRVARGAAAFDLVDDVGRSGGWWAGWFAYDLGRSVERIRPAARDDLALPDAVLARFGARLVLVPGRPARLEGTGEGRALLARALDRAAPGTRPAAPALTGWTSGLDRDEYCDRVRTVLGLLREGECYQVNLTRRLATGGRSDPAGLFAALDAANPAPHAALLALEGQVGVAVVSASPELFLATRDRHVTTRPVKGTAADRRALAASAKDRAENVMIVDLARNDLGRVCVPGTVRVPSLCAIEAHPGLHHLVSTVEGELAPGRDLGSLLAATMPPASVTGAPKPGVLQIIEDLEPVRRGIYCGAIGWIDADRSRAELAVAIRTFTVHRDGTTFGVGGGIVADSEPAAEWEETALKSQRLLAAAAGRVGTSRRPGGPILIGAGARR